MPIEKELVEENGISYYKRKVKEIKMTFVGRHHFRARFYHVVSIIFLLTMVLWGVGIIPDKVSTIIGAVLFVVDYLAEMYDPHPENPGPWFKSHFHRFFD